MSEDKAKLDVIGQRAAACPKWKWIAGMQAVVPPSQDGATGYFCRVTEGTGPINSKLAYPNFADPVTLGGLVALVREVTGKPHLFCSYRQEGFWGVADHDEFLSDFYRIEAEAWVEVLEEANVG